MTVSVLISVVITIVSVLFASVTAPLILAHRTEKMHREDRLADYERQDLVAKNAARAAEDLAASQKAIADQAAEAARLLLAANERVATTAAETNGKLDVIHTLVNSNMTAAMQAELDATTRELAMMREVASLNAAAGRAPTIEVLAAIDATESKISELTAAMADRAKAGMAASQPRLPDEEQGAR